ncbi:MAG: VRR-NUC domain-containing protein, partial [Bdellovibrionales bacterium]|nr:VRR-NUC domain-containing protein [Bdellovibrionales bacterium]NQZ20251.1 VRR-NUC domain-containing protein [Bdellovibrionales bacterium]
SKKSVERFNQCLVILSEIEHYSLEEKINILERGTAAPARMKLARLYKKTESIEKVRLLLDKIILDPSDDIELFEATEFMDLTFNLKKKTSTTQLLSKAETLWLDESYRSSVEYGAKVSLEEKGLNIDRSENELWLALFGILFWDLLFGEKAQSLANEFDRIPKSLLEGTFYTSHEKDIEKRLEQWNDLEPLILKNYTQAYGKKNALFHWKKNLFDKINRMANNKSKAIPITLRRIAQDYKSNKTGYPDLVSYNNGSLELIEIKGPGDVIRKNQIVQMRKLQEDGHLVSVLKVHFKVDPAQTYTVVDIETTGGRANTHRVTEIGAVKIKNGEVVDEFHSLVNPQRPIPKNIVRLTGINDQMVKNAPLFSEIAEDFQKFLKGTIFAAHHVNFDYGFIKEEYARLMINFRMPKFCTCAEARKYLKGPKRYGLAPLCEFYNVELENHHRALDDAKAAGQLLLLINKEREVQNGASNDS